MTLNPRAAAYLRAAETHRRAEALEAAAAIFFAELGDPAAAAGQAPPVSGSSPRRTTRGPLRRRSLQDPFDMNG